jgi:hypothetical protein
MMYEAIVTAIREATDEASAKGWQGYELQAHVFLAAFNAVNSQPSEPPQPIDQKIDDTPPEEKEPIA